MIEVEQKFILSKEEIARLTAGADFLDEKTFTDVYFDTAEFALTKNDMWLRKRGEQFDLKIPMHAFGSKKLTQQYQEIEGEEKIREIFAVAPIGDFESDIKFLGYDAFCICTTTRRKFNKDKFTIDVDYVDYGSSDGGRTNFSYEVVEIELMVKEKEQMDEAKIEIEKFATANGLVRKHVRGKVWEYLSRKKPQHYAALVEAGVVIE